MEAEWRGTTPHWQRDALLLLVAAVFAGEGLLAEGTRSSTALLVVASVIAIVALLRIVVRMAPPGDHSS
jgi:hypothetical protein